MIKNLISISILLLSLLIFTSCDNQGQSYISSLPVHSGSALVTITAQEFQPRTLIITQRTKVTWTNKDALLHTVTQGQNSLPAQGGFDSKTIQQSSSWSYVFTKPGTYNYTCGYHPDMNAVVIVR